MVVKVTKPENWEDNISLDAVELWTRMRGGDEEALSKLFCMFYPCLFNYGYKMVPRQDFIKDSIQELFLTLWKKRGHIKQAYSVKSYLYHSLQRIIMRNLTKQKNRSDRNQLYVETHSDETHNVEEILIYFETEREKKRQLDQAIQSLSKRQQEAIFLKFYEGLSNTEIASVMEINQQSVYNHVSKAIGKLQEFVKV